MDAMLIWNVEMVLDPLARIVIRPVRRDGTLMKFCASRSAQPSCRTMAIIKTYHFCQCGEKGHYANHCRNRNVPGNRGGNERMKSYGEWDLSLDYQLMHCLYFDGTNFACKSYPTFEVWTLIRYLAHEFNKLWRGRQSDDIILFLPSVIIYIGSVNMRPPSFVVANRSYLKSIIIKRANFL